MELITFLFLLSLGWSIGTIVEKKHYERINELEKEFVNLPVITAKNIELKDKQVEKSCLVQGSVVISLDYFKRVLAGLRNIFGGRIKSYETLIDRARREALLRLKQQAKILGADSVVNLRFETSAIGQTTSGKNQNIGCFEVLAYGTALKFVK